jgi:hypothetical protein
MRSDRLVFNNEGTGRHFAHTYRISLAASTALTGHNGHRQNLKIRRNLSLKTVMSGTQYEIATTFMWH